MPPGPPGGILLLPLIRPARTLTGIGGGRPAGVTYSAAEMPMFYRALLSLCAIFAPQVFWPKKHDSTVAEAGWSEADWELDCVGDDVAALCVALAGLAIKRMVD